MNDTPCIVSRDLARYERDMERYEAREDAITFLGEDLRYEFRLLDPIYQPDGDAPSWIWTITREGHGIWDDGLCATEAEAKIVGSKEYGALLRREAEARLRQY